MARGVERFFGAPHPDQDFYYRDELHGYADQGIVELHTAFSRHGETRTYVQDVLREKGDRVWDLIEGGAKVYVCGDGARMEPDVRGALIDLHSRKTGASRAQSEAWMDEMTSSERYVLDVWAG